MAKQDPTTRSEQVEKALETAPAEMEGLVEVLLNHALEAEANFLSLYDVAIEKVQASEAKEKLRAFRKDHEEHARAIVGALDQLECAVYVDERKPTPMAIEIGRQLKETRTDEELLTKFLASEDLSRHLYAWMGTIAAPEPVARIAQRGLDDEERHYAWARKQLGLDAPA